MMNALLLLDEYPEAASASKENEHNGIPPLGPHAPIKFKGRKNESGSSWEQ